MAITNENNQYFNNWCLDQSIKEALNIQINQNPHNSVRKVFRGFVQKEAQAVSMRLLAAIPSEFPSEEYKRILEIFLAKATEQPSLRKWKGALSERALAFSEAGNYGCAELTYSSLAETYVQTKRTGSHYAARAGDLRYLTHVNAKGSAATFAMQDCNGEPPVLLAAKKGHEKVVKEFLVCGLNGDPAPASIAIGLFRACVDEKASAIKCYLMILDQYPELRDEMLRGTPALIGYCIACRYFESVEVLFEEGFVSQAMPNGILNRWLAEIVQACLDQTVSDVYVQKTVFFLIAYGACVKEPIYHCLDSQHPREACNETLKLLYTGLTRELLQIEGLSMLRMAESTQNLEFAKVLIEKGVDVSLCLEIFSKIFTQSVLGSFHEQLFRILLKGKNAKHIPMLKLLVEFAYSLQMTVSKQLIQICVEMKEHIHWNYLSSTFGELYPVATRPWWVFQHHLENVTLFFLLRRVLSSDVALVESFRKALPDSTSLLYRDDAAGRHKDLWGEFLSSETYALEKLKLGQLPVRGDPTKWNDHQENSLMHATCAKGFFVLAIELLNRYPGWDFTAFNRACQTPLDCGVGHIDGMKTLILELHQRKIPYNALPLLGSLIRSFAMQDSDRHHLMLELFECLLSRKIYQGSVAINMYLADPLAWCYAFDINKTKPLADLLMARGARSNYYSAVSAIYYRTAASPIPSQENFADFTYLLDACDGQYYRDELVNLLISGLARYPSLRVLVDYFKVPSAIEVFKSEWAKLFLPTPPTEAPYFYLNESEHGIISVFWKDSESVSPSFANVNINSLAEQKMLEHMIVNHLTKVAEPLVSTLRNTKLYKDLSILIKPPSLILEWTGNFNKKLTFNFTKPANWIEECNEIFDNLKRGAAIYGEYFDDINTQNNGSKGFQRFSLEQKFLPGVFYQGYGYDIQEGVFLFVSGLFLEACTIHTNDSGSMHVINNNSFVGKAQYYVGNIWDFENFLGVFEDEIENNFLCENPSQWNLDMLSRWSEIGCPLWKRSFSMANHQLEEFCNANPHALLYEVHVSNVHKVEGTGTLSFSLDAVGSEEKELHDGDEENQPDSRQWSLVLNDVPFWRFPARVQSAISFTEGAHTRRVISRDFNQNVDELGHPNLFNKALNNVQPPFSQQTPWLGAFCLQLVHLYERYGVAKDLLQLEDWADFNRWLRHIACRQPSISPSTKEDCQTLDQLYHAKKILDKMNDTATLAEELTSIQEKAEEKKKGFKRRFEEMEQGVAEEPLGFRPNFWSKILQNEKNFLPKHQLEQSLVAVLKEIWIKEHKIMSEIADKLKWVKTRDEAWIESGAAGMAGDGSVSPANYAAETCPDFILTEKGVWEILERIEAIQNPSGPGV